MTMAAAVWVMLLVAITPVKEGSPNHVANSKMYQSKQECLDDGPRMSAKQTGSLAGHIAIVCVEGSIPR